MSPAAARPAHTRPPQADGHMLPPWATSGHSPMPTAWYATCQLGGHVSPGYASGLILVRSPRWRRAGNVRQLAWSMIPGGMSLVAVSFFGSSWYLAGKIRSEALAVGPPPAVP